ncbi:hypothetical protein CPC08DRAFT_435410 [Agrocybe pediades]|nr:hypothetical protein CPC08DRAFT_435410 [Agrocybe pediades]
MFVGAGRGRGRISHCVRADIGQGESSFASRFWEEHDIREMGKRVGSFTQHINQHNYTRSGERRNSVWNGLLLTHTIDMSNPRKIQTFFWLYYRTSKT